MKNAHAPAEPNPARDLAAEIQASVHGGKNNSHSDQPVGQSAQLLEQKFHALNQLSGGIAHEFNNIIAGILGSAELIAMDIHEGHPAHESLKQIFEASNRARDFLHKIRIFAQRPPAVLHNIPLPAVIEETFQILRGIIPDKVGLTARIQPGCPHVRADAAQIHQVLLDLCMHCWQNLHERRGQITVTLDNLPADKKAAHLPPGEFVHLTVQDDSLGLETHALKKLFDPFHTRKNAKKIGLELFIAREIIHGHHGEILASSEPGHGLTFHIFLPAADAVK